MTPRVIATTLLRDNTVRFTVGLFVFTLMFALNAAVRVEATVHQFVAFIVAAFGAICLMAFLYLIDYAARLLRPGSIVWHVGETGIAVVKGVYPHLVMDPKPSKEAGLAAPCCAQTNVCAPIPPKALAITGQFLNVDEGNKAQRMVMGFGKGEARVDIQIQMYEYGLESARSAQSQPSKLLEFLTVADSGSMPGALVTGGAGAVSEG